MTTGRINQVTIVRRPREAGAPGRPLGPSGEISYLDERPGSPTAARGRPSVPAGFCFPPLSSPERNGRAHQRPQPLGVARTPHGWRAGSGGAPRGVLRRGYPQMLGGRYSQRPTVHRAHPASPTGTRPGSNTGHPPRRPLPRGEGDGAGDHPAGSPIARRRCRHAFELHRGPPKSGPYDTGQEAP